MFKNTRILITGGSGSWGHELVSQLMEIDKYKPKEIRIYSRGEHKQVEMKREFNNNPILKFIIGDVRDKDRLIDASRNVDYIFHLAALKHVPVAEENCYEAVLTNIIGTQNVIEAAIINKVKKVIDVSTDKAVEPFNLYGVTKACAEKLIIAANNMTENTKFVCVRGGNVLGTAGSVVPLFKSQILKANKITVTEENMTRYFLTLKQAISLLFIAAEKSVGGEIFVMKMPGVKIRDLADVMITNLGNSNTKINKIGIRPGEKMDEVLVSKYEGMRVVEDGSYYIILPMIPIKTITRHYKQSKVIPEYTSKNTNQLSKNEIAEMLIKDGWLSFNKVNDLDKMTKEQLMEFFKREGWMR